AQTAGGGIGGQRLDALGAGLLPATGLGGFGGELAQQRQLTLADHALGVIGVGADDAGSIAIGVRNRAVGKGVIGLLGVAMPLHDQELLLDVGALVALYGLRQH